MSRTVAPPPTDARLWRRVLALAHPDAGGDSEAFVWLQSLREYLDVVPQPHREYPQQRRSEPPPDNKERVPYPDGQSFEAGTVEALRLSEELGTFHVYGGLLAMLEDCEPMAQYARQQERGASYKQLAAIGHTVGMSGPERSGWYAVAKGVPLSDRHTSHILGRLKAQAA